MAKDKSKRKQMVDQYKQQKISMGIYQLQNKENNKIFIESINNLKSREFTLRMMLDSGRHPNKLLQEDWTKYGSDSFEYTVLEEVEIEHDVTPVYKKQKLDEMKTKWLEDKKPFGDVGYNKQI